MKNVARLRGTTQSLSLNFQSLSSEKEVLVRVENDGEFIRDRARAKEALLAAKSSNLAQQVDDI